MSAGWVAGSVRARAIARRRLGAEYVRTLATSGSLADAIDALAGSSYGRFVHHDDTLADATRGVAETLLWNLRVLAGWLPARGAETLRVLSGWFEIANVEEHLRSLAGEPAPRPFRLGALASVWPNAAASTTREDLRAALATSPWGDPGGSSARDIQLSMRLAWAERAAARVPPAHGWSLGAAALLVAREHIARRMPLPERAAAIAVRLLGPHWTAAGSLEALCTALPSRAQWTIRGLSETTDLWEGEARWWRRLRTDSAALLARSGFGSERIVGAAGLLAVDAWLVSGALETAALGSPERRITALEVLDGVA